MSKDQIEQLADAVADRLNGSLSGLRKDVAEIKNRLGTVEDRLGTVEEIVSSNASKIEDLHGWMGSINGRITDLETADQ